MYDIDYDFIYNKKYKYYFEMIYYYILTIKNIKINIWIIELEWQWIL